MNTTKDIFARGAYVQFLGEIGAIDVGGAALQQLALANANDRGLVNAIQRAQKAILARGK